jgi:DNA repair exonuclease SbcCD ATPase subunit
MPQPTQTRKSIPIWLFLLLLAVAIGNGIGVLWQARVLREQVAQIGQRTRENVELRRELDRLSRAPSARAPALVPPALPRLTQPNVPATGAVALAAAEQQATRMRDALGQSSAEVARLQSRVSELQTAVENATEENRRLASAAEELKRNLADANQTIETIRAELKSNTGRMAQIESANAKLKEDASTAGQSAAQLKQTASELESLFRRREMYLNNILRRYREITEQYRAMTGVLASRRDREAAPVGSTEIARIQNAIALAEEDLKQIDALNAQASRLEKKLPAK